MNMVFKRVSLFILILLFMPITTFATPRETQDSEGEVTAFCINENGIIEIAATAPTDFSLPSFSYRPEISTGYETLWTVNTEQTDSQETSNIDFEYSLSGYVKTKGQENVPVYTATSDYTETQKLQEVLQINNHFPEIEIMAIPTSAYNCHSYAWYLSSQSNQYWINDVGIYANDVHTEPVEDSADICAGDIVIYIDIDYKILHSAIISEITNGQIVCESKWGASVLCQHAIVYVPGDYYASNGALLCMILRVLDHNLEISSHNASGHTVSCSDCSYSYIEPHKMSPLNVCRTCGYSGPLVAD